MSDVREESPCAEATALPTIPSSTQSWQELNMGINVLESKYSVLHGSKINHIFSLAEAGHTPPEDNYQQLQDENIRRFWAHFWIKIFYTICDLCCLFWKSFWWLFWIHKGTSSPGLQLSSCPLPAWNISSHKPHSFPFSLIYRNTVSMIHLDLYIMSFIIVAKI